MEWQSIVTGNHGREHNYWGVADCRIVSRRASGKHIIGFGAHKDVLDHWVNRTFEKTQHRRQSHQAVECRWGEGGGLGLHVGGFDVEDFAIREGSCVWKLSDLQLAVRNFPIFQTCAINFSKFVTISVSVQTRQDAIRQPDLWASGLCIAPSSERISLHCLLLVYYDSFISEMDRKSTKFEKYRKCNFAIWKKNVRQNTNLFEIIPKISVDTSVFPLSCHWGWDLSSNLSVRPAVRFWTHEEMFLLFSSVDDLCIHNDCLRIFASQSPVVFILNCYHHLFNIKLKQPAHTDVFDSKLTFRRFPFSNCTLVGVDGTELERFENWREADVWKSKFSEFQKCF